MTLGRITVAGISCLALLGFAGCGSDAPDPSRSEPINSASSSTPAKASEEPASSSGAEATCKLKGSPGGTATLGQDPAGLTMTFTGLPVPPSGTALYSVTAYDAAGEHGGQLGVKYQGGKQIAFFVFDFESGTQTNINGEAEASKDGVTATVPDADLGPLSGVAVTQWSAAYNVNGDDLGVCPGGIDSLPFPS